MSKAETEPVGISIPVGKCPRCEEQVHAFALVRVAIEVNGTTPNSENNRSGVFISKAEPKLTDVTIEHSCTDSAVAKKGDG